MKKLVHKALADYFTKDAAGKRRRPKPPVEISISEAASRFCLSMTLTYRAGSRYCCTIPGCLFDPVWGQLRSLLELRNVVVDQPIRIFLRVVYERGALIADNPGDPTPTYGSIEETRTDELVIDELEGWNRVFGPKEGH